ncbi:erythromycin esterase family protein [Brevundimonas aveniformis]|uniref:erythromycin esterase family protein n=1 Tax=Brevundimonas aveniformis TaxID=370977 RepID=UPI002490ABA0|nr:erythromycin esterase family protein [Brevundimonas aveniformis]
MSIRWIFAIILAGALGVTEAARAQTPDYAAIRAAEADQEAVALDAAVQASCNQRLVLLGENGFHGDGRTSAFKADLVRRLVLECGFDAVIFEASLYDFIALNQAIRRGAATPDMLSSAIGGLWNQNREVQDLIAFLFAEAREGRIDLAGMDNQLGSRGAFYSLERMPQDLAALLPVGRREDCAARLRQRIWSQFSAAEPYAEAHRTALRQCLDEIDVALNQVAPANPAERVEYLTMTSGYRRALDRDFLAPSALVQSRDRDMAYSVREIVEGLPADVRLIVWTANVHAARSGAATTTYREAPTMGAWLDQFYGSDVFAVGFAAAGGTYRFNGGSREIDAAETGSLEAMALASTQNEVVWLGSADIASLGTVVGSIFQYHQPVTATWSEVFDGVVVFRAERPPYRLDE